MKIRTHDSVVTVLEVTALTALQCTLSGPPRSSCTVGWCPEINSWCQFTRSKVSRDTLL